MRIPARDPSSRSPTPCSNATGSSRRGRPNSSNRACAVAAPSTRRPEGAGGSFAPTFARRASASAADRPACRVASRASTPAGSSACQSGCPVQSTVVMVRAVTAIVGVGDWADSRARAPCVALAERGPLRLPHDLGSVRRRRECGNRCAWATTRPLRERAIDPRAAGDRRACCAARSGGVFFRSRRPRC